MTFLVLQILGALALVAAGFLFAPVLGLVVLGVALLVFGTLEELR